jgi:hypothetical protein
MVKKRETSKPRTSSLEEFANSVEGHHREGKPWEGFDPKAARYKAGNPGAKGMTLPMNEYEYARLIEASTRANRKPLDFIRNAVRVAVDGELD